MTTTAPRLLLITPGFPSDEGDSLCTPPVQLMLPKLKDHLPDLGLSVLALHYPSHARKYLWNGIDVSALGKANHQWPLRLIDLVRARRLAMTLHARHPFSQIHALWLTDASLVASSLARSWACPWSATAMGQDVLSTNRYLRLLVHRTGQLITISDRAAQTLEQSTGRRPDHIIPWGIDPPSMALPEWQARQIDILGVGSLIEIKRWSILLDVCERLASNTHNHRMVLVGGGPLRASLEAEARDRGLGENLVFTGELPRSDVLRLMENARVLLHPSRFEGQGFVFSEALSRGMSVVSGPVGTAAPSERWRISEPDAMACECSNLLRNPPPTSALVLHSLEDTVDAYAKLWELKQ